jgi:uncharacterized membrane protein
MKTTSSVLRKIVFGGTNRGTVAACRTALFVGVCVAALAVRAFGSELYSIGVLNPDLPYSEVRAVSQDGTYAVGTSTSAGAGGQAPWAPYGTNAPVIWSLASGLVELPCPSWKHTLAHGVSVGISNNLGNIIISGLHEGYLTHRYYKAPLTNLAGGAWADSASAGGLPVSDFRGGTANNLRSHPGHDGRWYTGAHRANTRIARLRGDPFIGWDGNFYCSAGSVSAYGVVVARYSGVSPSTAHWESPFGDNGDVPGSEGFRADGIGISPSFGISTTTDFDLQWICGQVQNYGDAMNQMQAFRWKRGEASMEFLGALPDAISSVAYTVADNGVTAGRSYFGTHEEATVWDTSGTWDTTGQPKSLQALLEADGVDTSAWTRLSRVYAASDDGRVLAGFGVWAADGSTRGFVAVKSAAALPVVQITHATVSGNNVTISFTSSNPADTPTSFVVQSSATVGGPYADVPSLISGANGSFQAVLATDGAVQFYRIRRPF